MGIPLEAQRDWLAVSAPEGEAVASALGLEGLERSSWARASGNTAAGAVFVSAPLDGWTLVVGFSRWTLVHGEEGEWRRALEGLSGAFGEAQLFSSQEFGAEHAWARARGGSVERAFSYVSDGEGLIVDLGEVSEAERALGLRDAASRSPEELEHLMVGLAVQDVMGLAATWGVGLSDLGAPHQAGELGWLHIPPVREVERPGNGRPWWRRFFGGGVRG